jgi:hypothetical protein
MKNTLRLRIAGSGRFATLATAAILSALVAPAAHATLLFSEDFNHAIDSALPTSSVNGDPWVISYNSGGTGSSVVKAQTLTPITNGGLTTTSTGGQLSLTNREITHTFAESDLLTASQRAAGGTLYLSFVATIQNSSTDGGNGEIKLGGSTGVRFSSGVQWKSTTWGLGAPSPSFQSSGVTTLSPTLIVFKIDYISATDANISYYVNPTATLTGGELSLSSSPSASLTALNFGYLNQIIINTRYTGLTIDADAIKVGTALADVVSPSSIPEPAHAALIGGASLLGVAAFARRR